MIVMCIRATPILERNQLQQEEFKLYVENGMTSFLKTLVGGKDRPIPCTSAVGYMTRARGS